MSNSKSSPGFSRKAAALAALAGVIVLAACGGNNDVTPATAAMPGPAEAVPASASASVLGFIAYLKLLTPIQDDTLQPVDVSAVVAPTDDTGLPTPL